MGGISMTNNKIRNTLAVLAVLIVLVCTVIGRAANSTGIAFESGHCAGCIPNAGDSLIAFTVITHEDFDSLIATCFSDRTRKEWLPPRPNAENMLVYVSLEGGGCEGCLDVVDIHGTAGHIVVEIKGGFQGECDKLMILGAWALLPRTKGRMAFRFHEANCSDEPRAPPY